MSTLVDVEARRERWAAIFADARAHPRFVDRIPPDPRPVRAVLVTVQGPLSWSWYWPAGEVEHTLSRAAQAIRRLTPKDAPLGVYRVTVNGTTREVVRAVREDV